ncbi:MAG TPA: TatD family nuclease-associated radical SAM protein [Elusimicrobiales bacterium]|nr:TatD family nuclease-associated radical SAM protein [Elusimicrobiales bacterium]
MNPQKPSVVYRYRSGLYVNLTNRCPTACVFCIKNAWAMDYHGSSLDLAGREPSPEEVLKLAAAEWAAAPFEELVFCGFGEPTMRLPELLACARSIKSGAAAPLPRTLRIRVNTNGLANAVWNRDVVPEMKGLIDSVHVSLNSADAAQWAALMRPRPELLASGFEKVKEFIRSAAGALPETFATAVEGNGADLEKFKALAAELGARPRIRGRLDEAGPEEGAGPEPAPAKGGVKP